MTSVWTKVRQKFWATQPVRLVWQSHWSLTIIQLQGILVWLWINRLALYMLALISHYFVDCKLFKVQQLAFWQERNSMVSLRPYWPSYTGFQSTSGSSLKLCCLFLNVSVVCLLSGLIEQTSLFLTSSLVYFICIVCNIDLVAVMYNLNSTLVSTWHCLKLCCRNKNLTWLNLCFTSTIS